MCLCVDMYMSTWALSHEVRRGRQIPWALNTSGCDCELLDMVLGTQLEQKHQPYLTREPSFQPWNNHYFNLI